MMRAYLRKRRVRLSPNATLIFENAITVRHQVQEVLYWETSNDEAAHTRIQEELAIYRTLLPTPSSLPATLLLDGGSRETGLAIGQELASNRSSVGLVLGGSTIPARLADPDPDPAEPVKFLRFELGSQTRRAVLHGTPMSVRIVELGRPLVQRLQPQLLASLAEDIRRESELPLTDDKSSNAVTTDYASTKVEARRPDTARLSGTLGFTGAG
jgi:hypothetical protein